MCDITPVTRTLRVHFYSMLAWRVLDELGAPSEGNSDPVLSIELLAPCNIV